MVITAPHPLTVLSLGVTIGYVLSLSVTVGYAWTRSFLAKYSSRSIAFVYCRIELDIIDRE